MARWDTVLTNARVATMRDDGSAYGAIERAAIAFDQGVITWLGPQDQLPAGAADIITDVEGRWITPALIDCHTHLVFGGNRAAEFEQRLRGVTYEEIARQGGGIMATVDATRAASTDQLFATAARRMAALLAEGVATVEIKSGYGLNHESEIKMLQVAEQLGDAYPMSIQRTFLGAHTTPREYKGRSGAYIDLLINEILPAVAAAGAADAVDAYCENIAFSVSEVRRLFTAARDLGLPVKLHADQLSNYGGAELAAEFSALSADHLEYTSVAGVMAMAQAGTVATLLPGAFLTLRETQQPPLAALRDAGVPIAIATDCNPGTAPVCSLQSMMNLATSLFRMTPEETLAGVTRNAAKALGLEDRGVLDIGKRADLAVWDIEHPAELSYWLGLNPLQHLYIDGDALGSR